MRIPVMLLAAVLGCASAAGAESPAPTTKGVVDEMRLPLSFELNEGQAQAEIRALSRGLGYGVMLTNDEMVLKLTRGTRQEQDVLRFKMIGSNRAPAVSGVDRLPGKVSYYVGRDASQWRTDIATYGKIKYDAVYSGIDMVYYGNQRQLEYDFIVAPGADPSVIAFSVTGAKKLTIEADGDLSIATKHGEVVQDKPVIYQMIDGERRSVDGRFVLKGRDRFAFELGAYDTQHELVIDPSLGFFTYFGDAGTDQIKSMAVTSPSGLTFFGGLTTSLALPGAANSSGGGVADGFISATGSNAPTVLLTLFIGGSGTDIVNGLALAAGIAPAFMTVAGITDSPNFPILDAPQGTIGGSFDAFVMKFNVSISGGVPSATLDFSTYLGGLNVDNATGVAVSNIATGSAIFVTGTTASSGFPTTAPYQATKGGGYDAFLAKFNSNGTVAFSTFIGWAASEQGTGVAVYNQVTPAEAIPVISATMVLPGSKSLALAVSLTADGSTLRYAKAFGAASSTTVANGVAVDAAGAAYLGGGTDDPAFPMVNAVQGTYGGNSDAFVVKLDSTGTNVFSSYYGGTGYDRAFGIAVDTFTGGNNNIILGGLTTGTFPTTAVQTTYGGGAADGFVVLLAGGANYTVGYATYLGGTGVDVVYAVCVGSQHNARAAGITNSPGLATAGVAQTVPGAEYDGFVARIQTTP